MVQEPALAEAVSPATEAGVPVTPPAPARETFAPQPSPREPAPTPERVTPKVAALVTKAREEPVTRRVTEEPPVAARAGPKGRAVLGLKTKVEAPTTIKEKAKPIPEKLKEKIEAAPRKTEQKKEEIPETKAEREERLERERAETREKLADQAAKEHVEALEKKAAADKAKREGETGTAQEKEKITPKKAATGEISSASLKNRKREDVERTAVRIGEKLGENAPEPVKRILALKEARKPFAHGRSALKDRERERIHALVDAEIDKWVAELEAAEAAREPSPQEKAAAREKELAETKTVLERQLTESETEEITARNRKAQQEEAYKAENDAAKAAVDQHFVPKMAEAAKTWDLATLREGVRAARAAFKGEVPAELGRDQGPWVNFLVYAGRKTSKAVEIVSAYTWVAKGQTDEFYSYAMDDPTVARVGVSGFEQEADDTLDLTGKKIDDSAMVAPADIESWLEASEEPGKGQVLTVKRRDGTTYTHQLREKQSHTAASLLKSIGVPASFMESPLVRAIDKRVRQELTRLVGNTPVYVVPDHVIDDIREAGDGSHALGLFIAPTVAQRAQGYRGAILVVEGATRNHAQYAHVLKHEMTHAAVDFAYDTNFKNSKEIFDTLFLEASTMGLMTGVLKKGEYGLTSPKEFMAEAISNPRFQEKLSRLSASPGLATALKSMPMRGGLLSSMWQKFVAQVSRIIGANIYGNAGMSYTEATLTLFGATAQEKAEMMAWAERQRGTAGFTSARTDVFIDGMRAGVPDGKVPDYDEVVDQIFDAPLLSSTAAGHVQTVKEWFDTKGGQSSLRQNRYRYTAFTKDLRNLVTDMLGDTAKPLVDAMNAHLGRDALRSRLSEAGDKVAAKLLDFRDRHKKEADAMEAWFDQATRSGSDPRYDKTDARNKQIAVPSFRTRWKRKENDKLHAAFNKFSPEAKALINEAVDAYKTMHKETAEETISTILDAAVKASGGAAGTSIALPKSETVQSVTQWVTSGEIDKPKSQQSQRDKDIHKALNTDSATGVGGLIKNNPALRVLEGMYVPLMRRGKNVVSATKDYTLAKNLPAGRDGGRRELVRLPRQHGGVRGLHRQHDRHDHRHQGPQEAAAGVRAEPARAVLRQRDRGPARRQGAAGQQAVRRGQGQPVAERGCRPRPEPQAPAGPDAGADPFGQAAAGTAGPRQARRRARHHAGSPAADRRQPPAAPAHGAHRGEGQLDRHGPGDEGLCQRQRHVPGEPAHQSTTECRAQVGERMDRSASRPAGQPTPRDRLRLQPAGELDRHASRPAVDTDRDEPVVRQLPDVVLVPRAADRAAVLLDAARADRQVEATRPRRRQHWRLPTARSACWGWARTPSTTCARPCTRSVPTVPTTRRRSLTTSRASPKRT